jgi:hypothetical protein
MAFSEISDGKVINIIECGVDISLPQVVTEEVKPTVPVEQPATPVLGE